jgi:hypothetical protein
LFIGGRTQQKLPWADVDYVSAPIYADDEFELRLDLAGLGIESGDTVTIQFGGSDSLSKPARLSLSGKTPNPAKRPTSADLAPISASLA